MICCQMNNTNKYICGSTVYYESPGSNWKWIFLCEADRWLIGAQIIHEGRIKGVVKFGNTWTIPENAEKPKDEKIK